MIVIVITACLLLGCAFIYLLSSRMRWIRWLFEAAKSDFASQEFSGQRKIKEFHLSVGISNLETFIRCLGQICSVEKGSPTKRSDVSDIRRAKEHQCGSQGCSGQWNAKSQLRERRTFLKRETGGQAEISQSVLQTTTSPFWLHRWEAGQRPPFRHFLQVLQLFLCSGIWAPSKNKN